MARRIWTIDFLRGVAIVLMVTYHIIFDLHYLGIARMPLHDWPLLLMQRTIAILFLGLVGASLVVKKRTLLEDAKRAGIIFAFALLVTVATSIWPGRGMIVWGVLHFIALSILLGHFFVRLGKWNALAGFGVIALWALLSGKAAGSLLLLSLGFPPAGFFSYDYYPLLPWFSLVLFGMAVASTGVFQKLDAKIRRPAAAGQVCWLGRHSLAIYLVHQPIILSILLFALGKPG
ncbi:MAG: heparan-alpha-glucosaminide N-acetyltransferase [Candidatus Micrarchaeia archaeon]